MTRTLSPKTPRGSTTLVVLIVLVLGALSGFLAVAGSSSRRVSRIAATSEALVQAREALIAHALVYRDLHPEYATGYLPCPDTDGDGESNKAACGTAGEIKLGRLPWKTLGLPPLRDGALECLWYAVSGAMKDIDAKNPANPALNWDTPGQFVVKDVSGVVLAGATAHERPVAVILAPHSPVGAQTRSAGGGLPEIDCGGADSAAYLEGPNGVFEADTWLFTIADARSDAPPDEASTYPENNDRALWIASRDIFDRLAQRAAFKTEVDTLILGLADHLNSVYLPGALPNASEAPTGNKGIGAFADDYRATLTPTRRAFFDAWRDNLLYAGGPTGNFTLNESPTSCRALLFFGGRRAQRTVAPPNPQSRASAAEKNDATMYLEGNNALFFPAAGNYSTNPNTPLSSDYAPEAPEIDIARCINGKAAASASFKQDSIVDFVSTGESTVTITTPPGADRAEVSIAAGTGTESGCLWYSIPIPLAGKVLRAYYEFQFRFSDGFALGDATPDRGYGFTFQIVRGDSGVPASCGSGAAMGALETGVGGKSILVETDIYRNAARDDPPENHTAILSDGNLDHAAGSMSAACDGSRTGCRHAPANTFEESPPGRHTQRIEIETGCDATCATCVPASHGTAGRTHARIDVWSDCEHCDDIVMSMPAVPPPTVRSCRALSDPAMNVVHFGLTAGFPAVSLEGRPPEQAVVFSRLGLRSD
jgi:hypothetical protein